MKKFILTIISALASVVIANAQGITVSGVVTDAKQQPVVGAVVMLEGSTTVASVTDIDGKYTLKVPSKDAKLNVSCMSYKTQSVSVAGRGKIDFVLEDDSELLDEVVVVGYGSMRRSDLTGSVASVKVNEDDAAKSTSLDQLLEGRVSGVQVLSNSAAPDGGVSVRIRGLSSFNGSTEPLYVVDGVIINGASSSETSLSQGSTEAGTSEETNGLNGINPQDIASMEVLKDASATAIYGSQGANGVVLITTKSATKDKPVIRFNAGVALANANKKMDMLEFDDYVNYLLDNGNTTALNRIYENPYQKTGLKVVPINWQDYSLHTSVNQRYYFSVSGRPKTSQYFFSLGYNNNQGAVKNTGFEQYTMRFTLDKKLFKTVKVGTKINFSYTKSKLSQGASSGRITAQASMLRSILTFRPYAGYDIYDEESIDDDEDNAAGPDKWLRYFINDKNEVRVTPSIYAQWDIVPWLSFKSTLGADYRGTQLEKFKTNRISRLVGTLGSKNTVTNLNINWDNLFLVNKKFNGGHNLSGTLGMTMTKSNKDNTYSEGWWLENQDGAGIASINNGVSPYTTFWYGETGYQILSFLARAVYNYKDRYVLTATFRSDGSSRFQGKNKWAQFPSFAFAWRLNQEPWFNVNCISMAKVRLGWGLVGNQAVASYATIPTMSSTTVSDHTLGNESRTQIGVYLDALANRDLKWETTDQVNAGVDLGFFNGRLSLTVDLYNKLTRDLLQSKQIASSSGFSTMWVNQGTIQNRGIELSLDTVPVKVGDFEWTLGGNISFNRNRIAEIGADIQSGDIYLTPDNKQTVNYFWGSTLRSSSSNIAILNIFIENQPMGLFYGLKSNGIVQSGEDAPGFGAGAKAQPGDVKYVDINKNGYIDDDDRTIIGNPNPDFTFGFNTSLSWKNFTLTADFNGSYGNDIYNNNLSHDLNTNATATTSTVKNVRYSAYHEAWSLTNQGGAYPRLGYNEDTNYITDRYVEDGSYLRLANVALSYRVPFKKNTKCFIKGLNLGASCGNVFVWTKYSGWDPEVNSFGADIRRMGVDVGSYPRTRTYSFDVKFTF